MKLLFLLKWIKTLSSGTLGHYILHITGDSFLCVRLALCALLGSSVYPRTSLWSTVHAHMLQLTLSSQYLNLNLNFLICIGGTPPTCPRSHILRGCLPGFWMWVHNFLQICIHKSLVVLISKPLDSYKSEYNSRSVIYQLCDFEQVGWALWAPVF